MKKQLMKLLSMTLIMTVMLTLGACQKKDTPTDLDNNDRVEQNKNEQASNNESDEVTTDSNEMTTTQYPLKLEDSYKNEVTIEKAPETIVSLGPNITETLFALGAGEKVIGRTEYCDYPAEVKDIESVGDLFNPNIEKIIELNPDLVIASLHVNKDTIKEMKNQGINVVAFYWDEEFEGAYSLIETIGQMTNKNQEAKIIIGDMKQTIKEVVEKVNDLEKPSAYFVSGYGESGDFTATGDTFLGQMLEMAGAENAASDGTGWAYSIEKLIEKDPDLLIVSKYGNTKSTIQGLEGYKALTAVKEGKVIEVDENIFFRQGPRLAEGLEVLAKIFHPDVFEE